jgi:hypothetical protein
VITVIKEGSTIKSLFQERGNLTQQIFIMNDEQKLYEENLRYEDNVEESSGK